MRNLSLDITKFAMALVVVALHFASLLQLPDWLGFLLQNGVFRIAVPVFLLITGYYYPEEATSKFIVKFSGRLGILYLIWMAFYFYFYRNRVSFTLLIFGYDHLWYLIGVLGGGILLHFSRRWETRILICFSLSLYIVGILIKYESVTDLFPRLGGGYWISRNAIFFCYPFLVIGFLIKRHEFATRLTARQTALILVLGLLLLSAESLAIFYGKIPSKGVDLLFSLLIVSPCFLILSIQNSFLGNKTHIAHLATGVYLIHPFANSLLSKLTSVDFQLKFLLIIVISIVLSYILVVLNKRLKCIL